MKKQDQQQTLPRIVGVDAHSEKLVLCILQPALNGRSRDAVKLKTINCEVDRLEETFKKQTLPNDEIILEASTNSFSIVSRLKKIYRCATVIKSESVCGMSRKDKINDAVDAENIARFWLTGTAETVWTPDETTGIYRDILFGYRNATKDKVRASNRIWAFCSAHGFRLPARSRKQKVEAVRKQVLEFNWDKTMRFFIENLLKDYEHFCDLRNSFLQKIYEIVSTNESMLRAMEILGIRVASHGNLRNSRNRCLCRRRFRRRHFALRLCQKTCRLHRTQSKRLRKRQIQKHSQNKPIRHSSSQIDSRRMRPIGFSHRKIKRSSLGS